MLILVGPPVFFGAPLRTKRIIRAKLGQWQSTTISLFTLDEDVHTVGDAQHYCNLYLNSKIHQLLHYFFGVFEYASAVFSEINNLYFFSSNLERACQYTLAMLRQMTVHYLGRSL